jgi:hypothetical protein
MYVRWKRRPLRRDGWPDYVEASLGEQRLYAQLVESRRVDGKPRQRVVKHLGGIRERLATRPPNVAVYQRPKAYKARHWFWKGVDEHLAESVPNPAERERLASRIAATVPRVSEAEQAEWNLLMKERRHRRAEGDRDPPVAPA